jgi:hypothetical protein
MYPSDLVEKFDSQSKFNCNHIKTGERMPLKVLIFAEFAMDNAY